MIDIDEQLTEAVKNEVGDALRLIATYDWNGYDLQHVRKDLIEDYSPAELAKAFDQLEIEGMGYSHFQDLFHVGDMECAIYGFKRALIFHFPHDEFNGLIVSLDRDIEFKPESIISVSLAAMPPNGGSSSD